MCCLFILSGSKEDHTSQAEVTAECSASGALTVDQPGVFKLERLNIVKDGDDKVLSTSTNSMAANELACENAASSVYGTRKEILKGGFQRQTFMA